MVAVVTVGLNWKRTMWVMPIFRVWEVVGFEVNSCVEPNVKRTRQKESIARIVKPIARNESMLLQIVVKRMGLFGCVPAGFSGGHVEKDTATHKYLCSERRKLKIRP